MRDAADGRAAQHDLERDARGRRDERHRHDREVLQERCQHDAELWERVEAAEWRDEESAEGAGEDPSTPKTMLLTRWSNTKRRRGLEMSRNDGSVSHTSIVSCSLRPHR